MGMGNPLCSLNLSVRTLQKTWQAWFEETDPKIRKKLESNIEYLLSESKTFLSYVSGEWREAFKKPKKGKPYDEQLQASHVNNFIPSWERKDQLAQKR